MCKACHRRAACLVFNFIPVSEGLMNEIHVLVGFETASSNMLECAKFAYWCSRVRFLSTESLTVLSWSERKKHFNNRLIIQFDHHSEEKDTTYSVCKFNFSVSNANWIIERNHQNQFENWLIVLKFLFLKATVVRFTFNSVLNHDGTDSLNKRKKWGIWEMLLKTSLVKNKIIDWIMQIEVQFNALC